MNTSDESDDAIVRKFREAKLAVAEEMRGVANVRLMQSALDVAARRVRRRRSFQAATAAAALVGFVVIGSVALTSHERRDTLVAEPPSLPTETTVKAMTTEPTEGSPLRVESSSPAIGTSSSEELGEAMLVVTNVSEAVLHLDWHFYSDVALGWFLVGPGCGSSSLEGDEFYPSCDRSLTSVPLNPSESKEIPLRIVCVSPPCENVKGKATVGIRFTPGDFFDPEAASTVVAELTL